MAVYEFKGFNAKGKQIAGLRDADSIRGLKASLKREGIFPTEIKESEVGAVSKKGEVNIRRTMQRISLDDVAVMTRQLATLLGAGVNLVESLTALVDQTENERLKVVISQLRQRVNEGASLADALGDHPRVFPAIYVNMVRAGESSGALEIVLERLADYTENQAHLKQKIIGTMAYPAIMSIIGIGILMLLFVVVIPKLSKIFEDINATLPIYTQILITTANFAVQFWYLVILIGILVIYSFLKWKKSQKGRVKWDRIRLSAPIFGPINKMLILSRFARTLATLLSSGVPLLTALSIVKNIMNNVILEQVIEDTREAVREGESIAMPLKRSGEFPPIVTHMVAIGEKSGQLEQMLSKVADSYELQVNNRLNTVTSLLEPIMIVFMGGIIAFVVLSILMPILQINEYVQ